MKTENNTVSSVEEMEIQEVLNENNEVVEGINEIVFRKPYRFEDTKYTRIDLSGLDDLSANDMIKIQKQMERSSSGSLIMPEMTMEYACYLAAKATKQPIEFFYGLHPKEAIRLKNKVVGFLYGRD